MRRDLLMEKLDLLMRRRLRLSSPVFRQVRDWDEHRVYEWSPLKKIFMRVFFIARSTVMQRQFTIELRVDYADTEKTKVMRQAMQQAARHVYATATLLADGVKPQIAIFSDDFFTGHESIELLDDTISQGLAQIGGPDEDSGVSSELAAAVKT